MSTINQIKILDKVSHEYLVADIGVDADNISDLTLNKVSDINITNPVNDQVLTYDSTNDKWVNGEGVTVDTELSPTSENPVQNKVITNVIPDKGFGDTWSEKTWNGLTSFDSVNIWTDGIDIYYSYDSNQYVLDKSTSTWSTKTWNGLTNFNGRNIWTDGENIYHSDANVDHNYILDKSTSTWSSISWFGHIPDSDELTVFAGEMIWTDGDNIYFSGYNHYILDKSTRMWSLKIWNGLPENHRFDPRNIWTDGSNIFYLIDEREGENHYILDKSTSTWLEAPYPGKVIVIYYEQYEEEIPLEGRDIWTDGTNIYYSISNNNFNYVLDKSTSTWNHKTWNGLTNFNGRYVWTDGDNIYYSYASNQYVLSKQKGFGTSASKDYTTSVTEDSPDLVTSGAVYSAIDAVIGQVLNTSF